jgi:hypothetical protein
MHLDVDPGAIDAIEIELLRGLLAAIEPILQELQDLRRLKQLVSRTVSSSVETAMRPLTAAEYKKLPNRGGPTRKTSANGHAKPFADIAQRTAIIRILTDQPLLTGREVTDLMIDGGYPFTSKEPYASMVQVIGTMAKNGELLVKKPKSRVGGESNRYSVNPDPPASVTKHGPPRRPQEAQ